MIILRRLIEVRIRSAIAKHSMKKALFWLSFAKKCCSLRADELFLNSALSSVCYQAPQPEKIKAISILISLGANVNYVSFGYSKTPIEGAIYSLDLEAVKILVKSGANIIYALIQALNHEVIEPREEDNGSCPYYSVPDHPKLDLIVLYLLDAIEDKSVICGNSKIATAVLEAVVNGNYKIAQRVVKAGFEIDTKLEDRQVSGLESAYYCGNK